jgi:hypothetical protein
MHTKMSWIRNTARNRQKWRHTYLEVEFSRAEAVGGARPPVAQGPALPVHGQPGQEILLLDPANQINRKIKKIPSDSQKVNDRQFK